VFSRVNLPVLLSLEFHDCTLIQEQSEENGDALVVHLSEDR
jgi:tRNA-5-taurinomethyluridine 2-sulfurtransferase